MPPADIPLGIMKHSQAAAKMNEATVRIMYSFIMVRILCLINSGF